MTLADSRAALSGLSSQRVQAEIMLALSIAIWGLVMMRRGFIGLLGGGGASGTCHPSVAMTPDIETIFNIS